MSTSKAGLTAAAVKDDFGDGRWTLEAGVLVLADKGLACVDELDKMSDEDKKGLHEALEQQTVSVAKAGIQATLLCRCPLLAAANPKFGRFDPHQLAIEQIELGPALMSRFDLIFVLIDKANRERDAAVATTIAHVRRRAALIAQRDLATARGEAVGIIPENGFTPPISRELMRKYIAYAKKTIVPTFTPETELTMTTQYVDTRRQGEGEAAAMPITPRYLEAMHRLAEASAKARLSQVVEKEDCERAVRLVLTMLRRIAGEGGVLDVDIIASGTSRAQRETARTLLHHIERLDAGAGVTEDDIIAAATAEGVEERRAREMLNRLSEQGQIYAPDRRHYKVSTR